MSSHSHSTGTVLTTRVPEASERDAPKRIQLSRAKGWRMPENTVKVTRPGIWGNPFIVNPKARVGARSNAYMCVPTVEDAVACYREMFNNEGPTADALRSKLHELRGKNLACFCKIGAPCHADVLLELANAPPAGSKA